jgi:hypothetical protein
VVVGYPPAFEGGLVSDHDEGFVGVVEICRSYPEIGIVLKPLSGDNMCTRLLMRLCPRGVDVVTTPA